MDFTQMLHQLQPYGLPGLILIVWAVLQWQQNKQNFTILSGLLESIQYQSGVITSINEKINSNQYCPLMRPKTFQVYNFENENPKRTGGQQQ